MLFWIGFGCGAVTFSVLLIVMYVMWSNFGIKSYDDLVVE